MKLTHTSAALALQAVLGMTSPATAQDFYTIPDTPNQWQTPHECYASIRSEDDADWTEYTCDRVIFSTAGSTHNIVFATSSGIRVNYVLDRYSRGPSLDLIGMDLSTPEMNAQVRAAGFCRFTARGQAMKHGGLAEADTIECVSRSGNSGTINVALFQNGLQSETGRAMFR